jgi:transposase-like protein
MAEQRLAGGRGGEEREQAWRQVFAEQAQSGWSVARFCRERGITPSSFYFWRGELARRETVTKSVSSTMGFVEVGVTNANSGDDCRERKAAPIMIHLGQARVEVPCGFDRETLAQVLDLLHEQFAQRGASC